MEEEATVCGVRNKSLPLCVCAPFMPSIVEVPSRLSYCTVLFVRARVQQAGVCKYRAHSTMMN
jgi:hypothetical protein